MIFPALRAKVLIDNGYAITYFCSLSFTLHSLQKIQWTNQAGMI